MNANDLLLATVPRAGSHKLRNIRLGFALIVMMLVLVEVISAWLSWNTDQQVEFNHLSAIARMSSLTLDNYFDRQQLIQSNLAKALAERKMALPGSLLVLKIFMQANPEIRSIEISSAAGHRLLTDAIRPEVSADGLQPSFQISVKELENGQQLSIGRAVRHTLKGEWCLPLRSAIRDDSGQLSYILTVILPIAAQQHLWQTIDLPEGGSIGLLPGLYPANATLSDQKIYSSVHDQALTLYLRKQDVPESGVVDSDNNAAKTDYRRAFQQLAHYPLTVLVSSPFAKVPAHSLDHFKFSLLAILCLLASGYIGTRWLSGKQMLWGVQCVTEDLAERKHKEQALSEREEKYRLLTENAEEVIWTMDPQTMRFLYISPSVYKLRGYTPEEILANPLEVGLPSEQMPIWNEKIRQRLAALQAGTETLGTFYTNELEQRCKDGSTVWTEVVTNWYLNKNTGLYEIRGVTRNITERKKAEADLELAHDTELIKAEQLRMSEKILRESEKHIRVLFNSGNDPIFVYEIDSISGGPQGHFLEVNDVACSRLGYSRRELLLKRPEDIIAADAATNSMPNFKIAFNRKAVYTNTYLTRNGEPFPVEINAQVFELYDKTLFFSMARDITERKKAEADLELAHAQLALRNAELELISITDRLTGLYNRRKLDEVLTREIARATRYTEALSVIILDIDHFKAVNDQYGHQTGDLVLTEIASLLQSGVRETDILGRWGGEEFLIVCPNTSLEGSAVLAEHLRQMIQTLELTGVGHKTCSFGVAQMASEEPINAMIARADSALYRAKNGGRNRVEVDQQG